VHFYKKIATFRNWLVTFIHIFRLRHEHKVSSLEIKHFIRINSVKKNATLQEQRSAEDFLDTISQKLQPKFSYELKRFGSENDGGYLLAPFTNEAHFLLSGGVAGNIDFEKEIASFGIPVHTYDPTVKDLTECKSTIRHHSVALEWEPTQFTKSINLSTALSIFTADMIETKDGILKLDIEGSEWGLLEKCEAQLEFFQQICVEFHDFYRSSDENFRASALNCLDRILLSHTPVSLHSNNYSTLLSFGHAIIADVVEVTFVRTDLLDKLKHTDFRLSTPNNSDMLDYPITPVRLI
jgi:hypothetical protein